LPSAQTVFLYNMKKFRILYVLLSFIFLAVGIGIYLIFREIDKMIIFEWIPKAKFNIDNLPKKLDTSFFSNILIYNLPDMLWFISGILFIRFIWCNKIKIQKIYILGFYGVGLVLEISQLSENVPGTFDWIDLLFISIGAFVEGLLYNIFEKRSLV